MKRTLPTLLVSPLLGSWLLAGVALAQEAGPAAPAPAAPPTGAPAPSGGGGAPTAAGPAGGTVYVPWGSPAPGAPDANAHLDSSSRPTVGGVSADKFDLEGNSGVTSTRGTERSSSALGGVPTTVPPFHIVRRGDTLWEVSDKYFGNGWQWPKLWGLNPAIQNPHWIYPGDQVRLKKGATMNSDLANGSVTLGSGHFVGRKAAVPPDTVFLRDQGYIEDEKKDVWGRVDGSPEDQMILTAGDDVYLEIDAGHDVKTGQELTIFRPLRAVSDAEGSGTIVSILGTARVDRWDTQSRIARAHLTESYDVIERGAKIGPVGRRYDVVAPVKNAVDLWSHITASLYPHVIYGQNQVVFLDKGEKDGLVPGNRFFVVVKGDSFRGTLGQASRFTQSDVRYESTRPATIVDAPREASRSEQSYPDEVIGELRVLRVRDHTATAIVTSTMRELEPGQAVLARKGY